MKKLFYIFFVLVLASCQKETGDGGNDPNAGGQKPKLGTTWVFTYYTYYISGGLATSKTITWKAVGEETLGGEKWLKINETGVDTTVYYLREKSDGLYQYVNGSANLLCKEPAAAGQTYSSFNAGGMEDFTVISAGQPLTTSLGELKSNMYEGRKTGNLIDEFWYNPNHWLIRHILYRKYPSGVDYYKYSARYIQSITY